ncbi:MAG: YgfZ/GcvT domain-containing protein [Isosphaeraceae bacterium]
MLNQASYRAVTEGVAWSDRSGRVRLEVAGPDRAKFLHNLTTNDVKRLPVGRGCEAFVTSSQGKTLGFVELLACVDSILVCTDRGGLVLALPHFQKYGVFDDIVLEDRSGSTFEIHLAGPSAEELMRQLGCSLPEPSNLAHLTINMDGFPVLIVRDSPTGRSGFSLIGARSCMGKVLALLKARGEAFGLEELDPESFEVLRIEAGTPVFGRDVTERNLPQEIGRDARAINFVKGCYLGQETVARIDALGHVNQILRGLRLDPAAQAPAPGTEIEADGKRVGFVTSSAVSPGWNAPIALAMVRASHARAGTELSLRLPDAPSPRSVPATVADLPMIPRAARTPPL